MYTKFERLEVTSPLYRRVWAAINFSIHYKKLVMPISKYVYFICERPDYGYSLQVFDKKGIWLVDPKTVRRIT